MFMPIFQPRARRLALLASVGAVTLFTAGVSTQSPRFYPDDPIARAPESQDASKAVPYSLSQMYELVTNLFVASGHIPSGLRAKNINTIDEVPDSSWFTNRIGTRTITAEEITRGPNIGAPPDPSKWVVIREKTSGAHPGFTAVDGKGETWFLEFDPPAFAEGATVTIGGVPATDVIWIDSHMLSATTPAHSGIGWVEVTVTNPDGSSGTIAEGFRYGDFTPPVVNHQIAGTTGQNGWYTSDVTVTWTYEDPESTIDVVYCFNPYTQATEGTQFAICYVTSEGGETIVDVEVKKDTVPPVIALSPAYPETYAQGQQVPIALYCSDETSGVPPLNCTANQAGAYLDTSTVGTFVLSATAIDMAGHTTTTGSHITITTTFQPAK